VRRVNGPLIEVRELTRRFGATLAVDRLSFDVARGELLVLLGRSGCGKTTTLKMVNRLVEPSAGRVRIGGEETTRVPGHLLRRRIGYCFQQVGLFPHLSVAENVGVTPTLLGWDAGRIRRRVDELLELVELDPASFRQRRPASLSGGQAQRVGLARALAGEPGVLLLDEPFGALDPLTRDRLQRRLQAIRAQLDLTVLFVTHDMVEAVLLGDRIAVLEAGALVQLDTPRALLRSPANEVVAELMATPRRHAEVVDRLLAGPDPSP
jgi:osmoprotectant transport system ATP-binding protein